MQIVLGALAGLLTTTSALFTWGLCRAARASDDAAARMYDESTREGDLAGPVPAGSRD